MRCANEHDVLHRMGVACRPVVVSTDGSRQNYIVRTASYADVFNEDGLCTNQWSHCPANAYVSEEFYSTGSSLGELCVPMWRHALSNSWRHDPYQAKVLPSMRASYYLQFVRDSKARYLRGPLMQWFMHERLGHRRNSRNMFLSLSWRARALPRTGRLLRSMFLT